MFSMLEFSREILTATYLRGNKDDSWGIEIYKDDRWGIEIYKDDSWGIEI